MNHINRRTLLGLTGLGGIAYLIRTAANQLGIDPGHSHQGADAPQGQIQAVGPTRPSPTQQAATPASPTPQSPMEDMEGMGDMGHTPLDMPGMVGDVDHKFNGFNPTDMLTDFDAGAVSTLPSGQILHEYNFIAQEKNIELASNLVFAAWTYNGRVPGPTIRVREGDRVRVNFLNATMHPHTIHFHGIHSAAVDGVFEAIQPGGKFVYEFDARPFGVHLYHCHVMPLAKHIAKGLYGAFIIDPPKDRPKADHEMIMVMNGFDVDYDNTNEIYAVNTIPFHFDREPIRIQVNALVRIYLVNILEYDPINSFHLHANFFYYYPTGTSLTPSEYTDTIGQMQGQRGILEFRFLYPGKYMFHAHKTEFAELGWTGIFQVE